MHRRLKITLILFAFFVLLSIIISSAIFITNYILNKRMIEKVAQTYSNDKIQERLEESITDENSSLALSIDGETVIGVVRIDKINFEGLVYEGTSLSTLSKGVGHFENTPHLNGNVGLAAHNTKKYWAKLHTLEKGDTISYISLLGSKEYVVDNITTIDEENWSYLENTKENRLTLITCVLNNKAQRLCVQAIGK